MTDNSVSRRLFMAAAAAAPMAPAMIAADTSDRIRIFDPPPARIRILCTRVGPTPGFKPAELEQLKAGGKGNVEIFTPTSQDEMNKLLPECDVVFGQLNATTLAKAKNLQWVQNLEAGLEREMFPELVAHPCAMTNMARMYAPALGETCFAMLLSLTRGIQKYYVPQYERKEWKPARDLVEMGGKTMGVVAMGGLGQAMAKIAKYGFDMKVLAVDIKPMAKPVFVERPARAGVADGDGSAGGRTGLLLPRHTGEPGDDQRSGSAGNEEDGVLHQHVPGTADGRERAGCRPEGRPDRGRRIGPRAYRAVSSHWRSVGMPEHDLHSTQRWILARTPDPSHGAAGGQRAPLRARLAADERGRQGARLLIRARIVTLPWLGRRSSEGRRGELWKSVETGSMCHARAGRRGSIDSASRLLGRCSSRTPAVGPAAKASC